jgi:membrane protein required for beta-lactamase induction
MKRDERGSLVGVLVLAIVLLSGTYEGLWDVSDVLSPMPTIIMGIMLGLLAWGFRERIEQAFKGHPHPRVKKNEKNESPIIIGRDNRHMTVELKSKNGTSKIHLFCVSISGNREVLRETAEDVEVVLAPLNLCMAQQP